MFFEKSYQCKIALEIFCEFTKIVSKKTHYYTVERLPKKIQKSKNAQFFLKRFRTDTHFGFIFMFRAKTH